MIMNKRTLYFYRLQVLIENLDYASFNPPIEPANERAY